MIFSGFTRAKNTLCRTFGIGYFFRITDFLGVETVAKKKRKKKKSALSDASPQASKQEAKPKDEISDIKPEITGESDTDGNAQEAEPESENTTSAEDSAEEEAITVSSETLAEIGSPDKEQVFQKVAQAYEEVKQKREKYKKIGPLFVFVSGVAFLTLIFTLENKITFLILWVVTILYTVALMIRAEYKYHQFRYYLGLTGKESDNEDEEPSDSASDWSKKAESKMNAQEEQA